MEEVIFQKRGENEEVFSMGLGVTIGKKLGGNESGLTLRCALPAHPHVHAFSCSRVSAVIAFE